MGKKVIKMLKINHRLLKFVKCVEFQAPFTPNIY